MRVLFLYPNIRGMNMLPPSIAIFSALLKQEGHDCRLFDTTYWNVSDMGFVDTESYKEKNLHVRPSEKSPIEVTLKTTDVYEEFNDVVQNFGPDLIAVTTTEDLFGFAVKLLQSLRSKGRAKTIMGGVFATFAPEKILRQSEIDMVCVGEGEWPLLELCKRIENGQSYSNIHGLWGKEDGAIYRNGLAPTFDINKIPIMDLGIFEEARFYRPFDGKIYHTIPAETHRGCPYQCAYCNSPTQMELYKNGLQEKFFRLKDIERVREELLYYKNVAKTQYIYFWADTFLAMPTRYFDEFAEMYSSEIGLPFWCQTRPETFTEARVNALKQMGVHRIGIGIEHGNEKFREHALKRRISNAMIVEKLRILNDYGIKYSVNNIVGFPDETRDLALDTIRLNRELSADTRNMYTFTPFHGTPLRDIAVSRDFLDSEVICSSLLAPTVLDMPQFSKSAIEGIRRCFVPYVLLEEDRWSEIEMAEHLTPEGDTVWEKLMDECRELFTEQFVTENDN